MERAEVAANWAANVAPVVAHFGGSIGLIKTVQVGARTTRTCARANVLREPPRREGGLASPRGGALDGTLQRSLLYADARSQW